MKKMYFLAFFALFLMSAHVWGAVSWPHTDANGNKWVYDNASNTLTISGNGAMVDYSMASGNQSPVQDNTNLTTVIIEDGVQSIGSYAFYGCTNLTSITVPASVTKSGQSAFHGCSKMKEVHAASPDAWASIDFGAGGTSTPFYDSKDKVADRKFYFGNNTTANSVITFTPNLKEIKPYAFLYATNIESVNLPASVEKVGINAFDCNITRLTTNRTTPATTDTKSFVFQNSGTFLYVPSSAMENYAKAPWYNKTANTTDGAKTMGYSTDTSKDKTIKIDSKDCFGYPLSGQKNNIQWELSADGVLTFTGSGEFPTFVDLTGNENLLPWWRFRYLVHKAVIKGADSEQQITSIKNALKWCYALTSIDIQQSSLPEVVDLPVSDFLGNDLEISVPMSDLGSVLSTEPWSSMDIHLSEPVLVDEAQDNTTLLANCRALSNPVDVQLIRSLSPDYYNTFCSPIDIPADEIESIFGEDTDIRALEGSTFDPEENELYLNFSENSLEAIEAGVPYLIQPAQQVANPTFYGVATDRIEAEAAAVQTEFVDFSGLLAPYVLAEDNPMFLFMKANNVLTWGQSGTLKGMRAYFSVHDLTAEQMTQVGARLAFGRRVTTDEAQITKQPATIGAMCYVNGRIVIVRGNKAYSLQGFEL